MKIFIGKNYLVGFFCVVLAAVVIDTYRDVGHFSFINFDDDLYVTKNPHVLTGLSQENLKWAFSQTVSGHWQPVTWISHMADCQLFGDDPGAHHLVSVFIHAANAVLFLLLLNLLTGNLALSIFGAALLGLHPMRLESVAWISERKDVLSVFFGLIALLFYTLYAKTGKRQRYLFSFLFFILSLLSKPTFVTFPVLIILLDQWPLKRGIHLKDKIPFAIAALLISAISILGQKSSGGFRSVSEMDIADRFATAAVGYLAYLGKFFWPTGFGVFYPYQLYPPGAAAGAWIVLILMTALVCHWKKALPFLWVGWLWFLVSLLPLVGLIQIGGQSVADRWTYLPHLGLILGTVFTISHFFSKTKIWKHVPLAGILVLFACIWVTQQNLPYWRDSISLFTHTLEVSPNNFLAHTNLGVAYDQLGDLKAAASHFDEALRLNPSYPEALNNLGSIRARQGQLKLAKQYFEKALSIRPEYPVAQSNLALTYRSLK